MYFRWLHSWQLPGQPDLVEIVPARAKLTSCLPGLYRTRVCLLQFLKLEQSVPSSSWYPPPP